MGIDIRLPIGAMFSLLGIVLVAYGMMTRGDAMYERSLGININIWWGAVMLVFGALMLAFALKAKAAAKDSQRRR